MSKKKSKNKQRKHKEILKAQSIKKSAENKAPTKELQTHKLPIKNIKRDLKKTAVFAVVSITFLILLNIYDVSYQSALILLTAFK
ncbi:MAG: hypothetical protein ACOZAO_02885 [Patescibacteria group bacterium]